jgi:hypothetical protein
LRSHFYQKTLTKIRGFVKTFVILVKRLRKGLTARELSKNCQPFGMLKGDFVLFLQTISKRHFQALSKNALT